MVKAFTGRSFKRAIIASTDGGIDTAREEHAVRHVGALMQPDALLENAIEYGERGLLADRHDRAMRQRLDAPALDDAAFGDDQRLARQDARNAGEDRVAAGGELQLEQFVARLPHQLDRHRVRSEDRLRLRGEDQALRRLGIVKRLDAERIAAENETANTGIMQRDRIHAAQMLGEIETEFAIEMQRQLAIRGGGDFRFRHLGMKLAVIIDLAIRDQRGAARLVERLVAGREIDDRQPRLHHADIARAVMPVAVGAAMAQRFLHRLQPLARRRLAVEAHHAGDAAHQRVTVARNSR